MSSSMKKEVRTVPATVETGKIISINAHPPKKDLDLHPYRCQCSLVKTGDIKECPVHWMSLKLSEARH